MIADLNLERSVLGAAIARRFALQQYIEHGLEPAYFSDKKHKHISRTINSLIFERVPVDIQTIANRLMETGWKIENHPISYVVTICEHALEFLINLEQDQAIGSLNYYIEKLKEYKQLRDLIVASEALTESAAKLEMSPADLCAKLEGQLSEIRETSTTGTISLGQAMQDKLDDLVKLTGKQDTESFMQTGFSVLDRVLGGLRPGRSYIIAGFTGHGKTQLALQIALHVAKYDYPVHFVSLEMLAPELAERGLFTKSHVDHERAENFELTPTEWQQLREAANFCKTMPFRIGDKARVTIGDLWVQARALRSIIKTQGLFVLDYLGLVLSKKQERREREVADISQNLKAIANDLKIPVIALSQLRRPQGGTLVRPSLHMLRESGQIEQDADVVIFVWTDEKKEKPIYELIVAKNRYGRKKRIGMEFINGWWGQKLEPERKYDERT